MATVKDVTKAVSGVQQQNAVANTLQTLLNSDNIKKRFGEVLGKKAPAFISSILSATNTNPQLKVCEPMSIISSAMVAAALDLPINQSLGFAHLVPYSGKAQFQMGWRGYVQLAQRTGLYKFLNAERVYEGQIKSRDMLSGKIELNEEGKTSDVVVGYFAHMELLNGFQKTVYISKANAEKHGKRYSQTFSSEKDYVREKSKWTTDFDAMSLKTVVKMLLGKWAPLSTDYQMQKALQLDQAVINEDGTPEYVDGKNTIDAETVPTGDPEPTGEELARLAETASGKAK